MENLYRRLTTIFIIGILGTLAYAQSANPRYDVLSYGIYIEFQPLDNRIDAMADVQLKVLDETNFINMKVNGNIEVTNITDENRHLVQFIQDDTEKFEIMIRFRHPLSPGTSKTLHISFNGVFPKSKFDFFKELGKHYYSYIGKDLIELYAPSFWFPTPTNPLDRATYNIEITMPSGLKPFTGGVLTDTIDSDPTKTYIFKAVNPILPPSFIAGHYTSETSDSEWGKIELWTFSDLPNLDKILKTLSSVMKFMHDKLSLTPGKKLNIVEVSDNCPDAFGMKDVVFLKTKQLKAKHLKLSSIIRRIAYQKWLFPLKIEYPSDLWIPEGLAQYTAALYNYDTFGKERFSRSMKLLAVDALKYNDADTVHKGWELGIGSDKYNSVVVAKAAWIFHMLRTLIGDDNFNKLLDDIYSEATQNSFSTVKLAKLVEKISGKDYSWFFTQWLDSVDLPQFSMDYVVYRLQAGGFQTVGRIKQNVSIFRAPLQIKVITQGKDEMKVVQIHGSLTRLNLMTQTRPLKFIMDPNFLILHKSRTLSIQVHIVKGDEYMDDGDFLSAIDEYKAAIAMDPRNSLAIYKLGLVFYQQFNYNAALNTFRDSLNGNQKPKWTVAMAHLYIGKIFDVLGQRQRALAEYNKAINTGDNSHGALSEARKYLSRPFTRKKTFLSDENKTSKSKNNKDEKNK